MTKKYRSFTVTVNNATDYDLGDCIGLLDTYPVKYAIFGFEKGEKSDIEHIQAYYSFKNRIRFDTITSMIPRAHVELAKGNSVQNRKYCSKDGLFVEFGEISEQGKITWSKLEEAMVNPKENLKVYSQYHRIYHGIKSQDIPEYKKRILYRAHISRRYEIARNYNNCDISVCQDIDMWDNEKVVFVYNSTICWSAMSSGHNMVAAWAHGAPMKVKYGYEFRRFDPDIIIFFGDEEGDYRLYMNKYKIKCYELLDSNGYKEIQEKAQRVPQWEESFDEGSSEASETYNSRSNGDEIS